MRTSKISTLLVAPTCLALAIFLSAGTIAQDRDFGTTAEKADLIVKRAAVQELQGKLNTPSQNAQGFNNQGFQRTSPQKTTQPWPVQSPQLSPDDRNRLAPAVNRNLLPTNNFQQPKPTTPSQRMPFAPSTGLPLNSNRTALRSNRGNAYVPSPSFPANAKSVKKLYRADYEVEAASATMLQKLLTEKAADKVEAQVLTDDAGLTHLRVTTDEQTQQAIANFLAQVFPAPAKAKSVKSKPSKSKAVSAKLKPAMKFVSVKTPKMTCGGCAASVRATLTEANCSEIKCDAATKTCTFKVKNDINEQELLNSLAEGNHLLKDWEISKD